MLTISAMVEQAYNTSKEKGFHDTPFNHEEVSAFAVRIALIHSELAEALEAHRNRKPLAEVAEELADTVIRIGDLAGRLEIDLEAAIEAKMKRNRERPKLHGKLY